MRPHVKQSFRWAPHVSGLATVKPRDYQAAGEFEADNEYALWAQLRDSDDALDVGDLLETKPVGVESNVQLKICKFVGFESARWMEAEPATQSPVTDNSVDGQPQGVHP